MLCDRGHSSFILFLMEDSYHSVREPHPASLTEGPGVQLPEPSPWPSMQFGVTVSWHLSEVSSSPRQPTE